MNDLRLQDQDHALLLVRFPLLAGQAQSVPGHVRIVTGFVIEDDEHFHWLHFTYIARITAPTRPTEESP